MGGWASERERRIVGMRANAINEWRVGWRGGDRVESGMQVGEVRINKQCSVVSVVH